MTERTVPLLPCRDLDDVAAFYAALGFTQIHRQSRPDPYLCLVRGGIDLHFFAVDSVDPAASMGRVLLLVDDPGRSATPSPTGSARRSVACRWPASHGSPGPAAGRARPPASRWSTPIGNWLRVSRAGDADPDPGPGGGRLERVLQNAARKGDARGDDAAPAVLEAGPARHPGATDADEPAELGRTTEEDR